MSGDVPVRICEGLEVKFLRSTHLNNLYCVLRFCKIIITCVLMRLCYHASFHSLLSLLDFYDSKIYHTSNINYCK